MSHTVSVVCPYVRKKETFLTEDSAMKVIPPGHILTFCDADYSAAGNINLTIVATI